MAYDFSRVRAASKAKGLFWSDEFEADASAKMEAAGLTQPQVDVVAQLHLDFTCWLFTPQTYSVMQRVGLAFHFLFGKGLR